jgi:mannose/fructose/N-acetylgalactosamine-specific phosphotransferase system component IIC
MGASHDRAGVLIVELLWVSLAGMIVFLDTTAVAQFMICQPLIACPLWGLIVGRPEIGLFFGLAFQLIWLGSIPIGAARFPEGNIGALIATALAASVPAPAIGTNWTVLTIAALLGIASATVGSSLTPLVRRILNHYTPRVIEAAKNGQSWRFSVLFVGAVGIHALAGFLFTGLAYGTGRIILSFYGSNPAGFGERWLMALWPGLLGAGAGVIASRFIQKKSAGWFAAAAMMGLGAGWLWL